MWFYVSGMPGNEIAAHGPFFGGHSMTSQDHISNILALPADQRLDAAFDVIRDLAGMDEEKQAIAREVLGVPPAAARLILCLAAAKGRTMTREALMIATRGYDPKAQSNKVIDVWVTGLRKKLPPSLKIRTVHGVGYALDGDYDAAMRLHHRSRYPITYGEKGCAA